MYKVAFYPQLAASSVTLTFEDDPSIIYLVLGYIPIAVYEAIFDEPIFAARVITKDTMRWFDKVALHKAYRDHVPFDIQGYEGIEIKEYFGEVERKGYQESLREAASIDRQSDLKESNQDNDAIIERQGKLFYQEELGIKENEAVTNDYLLGEAKGYNYNILTSFIDANIPIHECVTLSQYGALHFEQLGIENELSNGSRSTDAVVLDFGEEANSYRRVSLYDFLPEQANVFKELLIDSSYQSSLNSNTKRSVINKIMNGFNLFLDLILNNDDRQSLSSERNRLTLRQTDNIDAFQLPPEMIRHEIFTSIKYSLGNEPFKIKSSVPLAANTTIEDNSEFNMTKEDSVELEPDMTPGYRAGRITKGLVQISKVLSTNPINLFIQSLKTLGTKFDSYAIKGVDNSFEAQSSKDMQEDTFTTGTTSFEEANYNSPIDPGAKHVRNPQFADNIQDGTSKSRFVIKVKEESGQQTPSLSKLIGKDNVASKSVIKVSTLKFLLSQKHQVAQEEQSKIAKSQGNVGRSVIIDKQEHMVKINQLGVEILDQYELGEKKRIKPVNIFNILASSIRKLPLQLKSVIPFSKAEKIIEEPISNQTGVKIYNLSTMLIDSLILNKDHDLINIDRLYEARKEEEVFKGLYFTPIVTVKRLIDGKLPENTLIGSKDIQTGLEQNNNIEGLEVPVETLQSLMFYSSKLNNKADNLSSILNSTPIPVNGMQDFKYTSVKKSQSAKEMSNHIIAPRRLAKEIAIKLDLQAIASPFNRLMQYLANNFIAIKHKDQKITQHDSQAQGTKPVRQFLNFSPIESAIKGQHLSHTLKSNSQGQLTYKNQVEFSDTRGYKIRQLSHINSKTSQGNKLIPKGSFIKRLLSEKLVKIVQKSQDEIAKSQGQIGRPTINNKQSLASKINQDGLQTHDPLSVKRKHKSLINSRTVIASSIKRISLRIINIVLFNKVNNDANVNTSETLSTKVLNSSIKTGPDVLFEKVRGRSDELNDSIVVNKDREQMDELSEPITVSKAPEDTIIDSEDTDAMAKMDRKLMKDLSNRIDAKTEALNGSLIKDTKGRKRRRAADIFSDSKMALKYKLGQIGAQMVQTKLKWIPTSNRKFWPSVIYGSAVTGLRRAKSSISFKSILGLRVKKDGRPNGQVLATPKKRILKVFTDTIGNLLFNVGNIFNEQLLKRSDMSQGSVDKSATGARDGKGVFRDTNQGKLGKRNIEGATIPQDPTGNKITGTNTTLTKMFEVTRSATNSVRLKLETVINNTYWQRPAILDEDDLTLAWWDDMWEDIWKMFGPGIDKLQIPDRDYYYAKDQNEIWDPKTGQVYQPLSPTNIPIVRVSKCFAHPIPEFSDTGREDHDTKSLKIRASVLVEMMLAVRQQWRYDMKKYLLMTPHEAMVYIVERLRDLVERIHFDEPEYKRAFQMVRWYAEAVVLQNAKFYIDRSFDKWLSKEYRGYIGEEDEYQSQGWLVTQDKLIYAEQDEATLTITLNNQIDGYFMFSAMTNDQYNARIHLYVDGTRYIDVAMANQMKYWIEAGYHEFKFVFAATKPGLSGYLSGISLEGVKFKNAELLVKPVDDKVTGSDAVESLLARMVKYYTNHHFQKIKGTRDTWVKRKRNIKVD